MVIKEENNSLTSNEKQERLSKWQKFCLGWTFATALLGVCLGFDNGSVALITISVCAIIVLICCYIGRIDRKFVWPVVIITYVVLSYICGSMLDKQEEVKTESTEQKIEEPRSLSNEKKNEEKKNHVEERSPKEKEVASAGYSRGYLAGQIDNTNLADMVDQADRVDGMKETVDKALKDMAGLEYNRAYGEPVNAEGEKLKKIYIEEFIKGLEKGWDNK